MLFTLILTGLGILFSLARADTFYINQNTPSASLNAPNGTRENPFVSLEQAVSKLTASSIDLVLLGQNIFLTGELTFASGKTYRIRPEITNQEGYFPLTLQVGSNIRGTQGNVTFEDIEFIEKDMTRTMSSTGIAILLKESHLTLKHIMLRNVKYVGTLYKFVEVQISSANIYEANLINSTFTNFQNVQIAFKGPKIRVVGCTFANFTQDFGILLGVSRAIGPSLNITFKKIKIENFVIGKFDVGLIGALTSSTDVIADDVFIKNVTFTATTLIFNFMYTNQTLPKYMSPVCRFSNWNIHDVFAVNETVIPDYIAQINGRRTTEPTILSTACATQVLSNMSISNFYPKSKDMLMLGFDQSLFFAAFQWLPSTTISNLTIINSTMTNIAISTQNMVIIENVLLQNCLQNSQLAKASFFLLDSSNTAIMRNFQVKNSFGRVLSTNYILTIDLINWDIQNHQMLSQTGLDAPVIVYIPSYPTDYLSVDEAQEGLITFQNFNVNGFSVRYDETSGNTSDIFNQISAIQIDSTYGKVYLKDSTWTNFKAGGFLSNSVEFIQVENFTTDFTQSTQIQNVPEHRLFNFANAREVRIINSSFLNQPNTTLFDFKNLQRTEFYDTLNLTTLTFQNLTIINNTASLLSPTGSYRSLFRINSPLKPVKASFSDCSFLKNTIVTGLILVEENYNVDLLLLDNTFQENFAYEAGSVLSVASMEQTLNTLTISNNVFKDNKCLGNGGVYHFSRVTFDMKAYNNVYLNNSAVSGGVGYLVNSMAKYSEKNGTYRGNSATKQGGCWFLRLGRDSVKAPRFVLLNTSFEISKAQNGGAIFLSTGDIMLDGCTFKASHAEEKGGHIFLNTLCSLKVQNSIFSESYAQSGHLLYGEYLAGETVVFSNVHMSNFGSQSEEASLVKINFGSINISNSIIKNTSLPLFNLKEVDVSFKNLTVSQISCPAASQVSPCFLEGPNTNLELSESRFSDIILNQSLISLKQSKTCILRNFEATNIHLSKYINTSQQQEFLIFLTSVKEVIVEGSHFENLGLFSYIKVEKSDIKISNTIFSNKNSHRFLQNSLSQSQNIQFLAFESSNSSISQTSFINNSPTNSLKGGAVHIFGTGGTHLLHESVFDENIGVNGGAITVEGIADNLIIENCEFRSNLASVYGGAIFFSGQSVRNPVIISQSLFFDNQATLGGGIYVEDQRLVISDSSFEKNKASQGGAIASLGKSSTESVSILLRRTTFTENTAKQGSALMSFGNMTFDYNTSKFQDNKAEYSGDLATTSKSIRLRIFEVKEAYLFIDGVSVDYMLADPETILIYDSRNSRTNSSIVQKPGREPNLIFEFAFYDSLNQPVAFIKEGSLTLQIESISDGLASSNSQAAAIIGASFYEMTTPTYIFSTFSLRGTFGSQITLSAKGTFFNPATLQVESISPLQWSVEIGLCHPGEIYDDANSVCSPCLPKTFSLADPFNATACEPCIDNAVCRGGGVMYPAPGYWRINNESDHFVKCRKEQACLGGEKDEGKNISLTGFCDIGYEGVACSACSEGYAKFGTDQTCVNCRTNALYYIKFCGYLIFHIFTICLTTRVNIFDNQKNAEQHNDETFKATLAKIIIDFAQMLGIVLQFDFRWPNLLDVLLAVTAISEPTNRDAFSIDCFIALIKQENARVFYTKLIVFIVQPVVYMLIAYLFWIVYFKVIKKSKPSTTEFRNRLKITAISILYILQPDIVQVTFELFNCKNYGASVSPKYFLLNDTSIECWTREHMTWTLAVAIPAILIWLILPYAIFIRWLKKDKLISSKRLHRQYSLMFAKYNDKLTLWELVVIGQKLVVIIISVFFESAYYQAYLSFLLILALILLHFKVNPYSDDKLDKAQILSLFSLAIILYSGLYYLQNSHLDAITSILLAVDVLSAGVFFGYVVYILRPFFRSYFEKFKSKFFRIIYGKQKETVLPPTEKYKEMRPNLLTAFKIEPNPQNSSFDNSSRIDYIDYLLNERVITAYEKYTTNHPLKTTNDSFTETASRKRSSSFCSDPRSVSDLKVSRKRTRSWERSTRAFKSTETLPSSVLQTQLSATRGLLSRGLTTEQLHLRSIPTISDMARIKPKITLKNLFAEADLNSSRQLIEKF